MEQTPLKASDVRVGNIVKFLDMKCIVDAGAILDVETRVHAYGVPITPEALLSAEYKPWPGDPGNVFYRMVYNNEPFLETSTSEAIILMRAKHEWKLMVSSSLVNVDNSVEFGPGISSKPIHYLHQIQNIVHSFYGLEIEFKL